jgi:hypothetical protein
MIKLTSGIKFVNARTIPNNNTMAMSEEINPCINDWKMNGLRINPDVAPTICIVLIKNLLE